MYSASVEDKATVFCAFVVQEIRPPASLMKYPEVECRCSAAYWAECERHRGGAVNVNERETGDLLPSAVC